MRVRYLIYSRDGSMSLDVFYFVCFKECSNASSKSLHRIILSFHHLFQIEFRRRRQIDTLLFTLIIRKKYVTVWKYKFSKTMEFWGSRGCSKR